jgi:hypothetical protein
MWSDSFTGGMALGGKTLPNAGVGIATFEKKELMGDYLNTNQIFRYVFY